ncbi:MAG: divalent-cation tolerance protein CutA [Pseudomonadota bacterium]
MTRVTFIYATAPNDDIAATIARALVGSGYAACVNIFPGVKSVYHWEGRTEEAAEIAMIIKTTNDRAAQVRDLILDRHPFNNPAIAAISIDETGSSHTFCDWIRATCR